MSQHFEMLVLHLLILVGRSTGPLERVEIVELGEPLYEATRVGVAGGERWCWLHVGRDITRGVGEFWSDVTGLLTA